MRSLPSRVLALAFALTALPIGAAAGASGRSPHDFVVVGPAALFVVDHPEGQVLWRTDGTSAGTYRLGNLCPSPCHGDSALLAAAPTFAIFVTPPSGFTPTALWASDGTAAGTVKVAEAPALGLPFGVSSVSHEGRLFFNGVDAVHGHELWVSDGTPEGTQVLDLTAGVEGSSPFFFRVFRQRVYFLAVGGLWTTDGTAGGTAPIASALEFPNRLEVADGKLLVFASDAESRTLLWSSDGTGAGTVPLAEVASGAPPVTILERIGRRLFFLVEDDRYGARIWVTNGSADGTLPLSPWLFFWPERGSLRQSASVRGKLVFAAIHGALGGLELWVSDGSRRGTVLLRDICPGECWSGPRFGAVVPGSVVFVAYDEARGEEPWVSDGSAAGTKRLADLCRGACSSSPFGFTRLGRRALFVASTTRGGRQLFATDGTPASTRQLTSFAGAGFPPSPDFPFTDPPVEGVVADGVFFFGGQDGGRSELWLTDGTPSGTRLVRELS